MPTLTGLPTLWDAAKLLDPDGTSANVAEVLDQDNEMLWDCPFMKATCRPERALQPVLVYLLCTGAS